MQKINSHLRRYHAPVWDEPLIMEMCVPGRRGIHFPLVSEDVSQLVGNATSLIPEEMQRTELPNLPELSEPDVLRHYLHLSQETLGMIGISLFGTCTMKYNPRLTEQLAMTDSVTDLHPNQQPETLQGVLQILYDFEAILCELSGMDHFTFQPAGGADAAYTHACITRAYHDARGELGQRNQIITSIQAHPCNPATAAAAGFDVVTLMLENNGYPSLEALKAAASERTAALMISNPDDMGIYNPEIKEWVKIIHDVGGLCFYDHANFNGVMSRLRAQELGFDACMFMLHKTFGAAKGGGGPAVGAYGCTDKLADFLPGPRVEKAGDQFTITDNGLSSIGRVREYFGNVQQVIKAYAWSRAMGAEGIREASDISVLVNNYMERELLKIRGITKSHPKIDQWRMEMTRYSLGELYEDTGVTVFDVANRMVDFGIDAPWMSHEPWLVPQPITPEAGEMWSKEDVDYWIAVLQQISDEAYSNPTIVQNAPHNQVVHKLAPVSLDESENWAMTWRAHKRKRAEKR